MRFTKSLILSVFAFLFIGLGASSCKFAEPEFTSFDGVEVTKVEDEKADILLSFTLNNPNYSEITLNEAEIDISVNNIYMGKATLQEPTSLPSNGTHSVELKMNLEMERSVTEMAVKLGFAILTNSLEIQLKGDANGKMGWIRKSFVINHAEKITWADIQEMDF